MNGPIPLIENGLTFSPFYFYTNFIKRLADFYSSESKDDDLEFVLTFGDESDSLVSKYYLDPIALPLLLSISAQLANYQRKPIKLLLSNNAGTNRLLEFLFRCDFFYLVGDNKNPNLPLGKKIFDFNSNYIGDFSNHLQRAEHKVRCYSLKDESVLAYKINHRSEEEQRDFLVEHFTFKVKEHFADLLFENENTNELTNDFIEIFSELITNGVLHSQSEAFALMFSDKFKTKFSISDNGIGLYNSLSKKSDSTYYTKFEIFNALSQTFKLRVSANIKNSVLSIFETLYYSMLKDRQGLFDLLCNIVIHCKGYFRLHTEYAQIIVSSRMLNDLEILYRIRQQIVEVHNLLLFGQISEQDFSIQIVRLAEIGKTHFLKLANSIFDRFNEDTRFSSIRLYEVKFRGVHIEVEIPNSASHDNI